MCYGDCLRFARSLLMNEIHEPLDDVPPLKHMNVCEKVESTVNENKFGCGCLKTFLQTDVLQVIPQLPAPTLPTDRNEGSPPPSYISQETAYAP